MTRTPPQNHIRAWREYRKLSLEDVAARIGASHSTLSRIERGLQPYNQKQLEALATVFRCAPSELLSRDPADQEEIWEVWRCLTPPQRAQAIRVLKALAEDAATR